MQSEGHNTSRAGMETVSKCRLTLFWENIAGDTYSVWGRRCVKLAAVSWRCRIRPVEFGCYGFVATSTSSYSGVLWSGRRSAHADRLLYGGTALAEKKKKKGQP